MLETLDRLSFRDSELPAEKRQAIQTEFDALAAHAQVAHGKLELLFRRGGGRLVGANALALPGGRIVVTDELLALAPAPADLAGVSLMKSLTSSTGTACAGWAASPDCPPWSC